VAATDVTLVMTEQEILHKIELCKVSNAPIELKEEVINNLLAKLTPADTLAKQQYVEGMADMSDLINSDN